MRSALLASLCFLAVAAWGTRADGAEPQQAQGDVTGSPTTPLPAIPPGLTPARVEVAGRLEFSIASDVTNCPNEEKLHGEVARRIGYDPFVKDAEGPRFGSVRVVIARSRVGFLATYEYANAAGVHEWTRTVEARGADRSACDRVFSALGALLAAELTVFARHVSPPAPAEPPTPPPPNIEPPAPPLAQLEPASVAAPLAAPAPLPSTGLRGRVEVGGTLLGVFGVAPAPTVGGSLHLGLALLPLGSSRWWYSLGLEGRVDVPALRSADKMTIGLLAGSALVCVHAEVSLRDGRLGFPFACALGTWGRVRAAHEFSAEEAASTSAYYTGIGGRIGLEARLAPFLSLVAHGDLHGATEAGYLVVAKSREAWRMPDVSGELGLGALFSFDIFGR